MLGSIVVLANPRQCGVGFYETECVGQYVAKRVGYRVVPTLNGVMVTTGKHLVASVETPGKDCCLFANPFGAGSGLPPCCLVFPSLRNGVIC
jgi:hypothetical protein